MTPTKLHQRLERLANLLRRETRTAGADYGLQPVQWEALHYLSRCNRYSDMPQAVTEYLGSTKGTVSQTLKVLEKKGFISKHLDPGDRRVVHMRLTGTGRERLHAALPAPALVQACENLSAAQLSTLDDGLEALLGSIQQTNGLRRFGVCKSCHANQAGDQGFLCSLTGEPLSETEIRQICREHQQAEAADH